MFFQLFCASLIAAAVSVPAGVYVGKNGEVGASWGGYSASAGLGGVVGGTGTRGGLHAEAGTPDGHFAAAGLGGSVSDGGNKGVIYSVAKTPTVSHSHASASSVASSGASAGSDGQVHVVTTVNKRPHGQSFFDDIFNIPISVLGAVNKYLNNNVRKGVVHVHGVSTVVDGGHGAGHVTTTVVKPVVKPVVASHSQASAVASASASASSSANSNANTDFLVSGNIDNNIYHQSPVKYGGTKYDDIFNIPVSVLGAVNRLLNNGKK